MKILVLSIMVALATADTAEKQEVKPKTPSAQLNTIPPQQKYETFYQPISKYQQQAAKPPVGQPQYVQIIQRPYYVQQPQPHAMIIIAQPALVPSSVLYGNPTQQLLNYFHNNPQAKYQLLHGNYQQQQVVPVPAQSIGHYILAPAPQYQQAPVAQNPQVTYVRSPLAQNPQVAYVRSPAPLAQNPQVTYVRSPAQRPATIEQRVPEQNYEEPGQLAQLAQLAAQQFASNMKSAPAIVTGFENFTPEQQAQIKKQLNAHLGTNYHAVAAEGPYSSKYAESQTEGNFVPSQEVKNEEVATGREMKTRYNKG